MLSAASSHGLRRRSGPRMASSPAPVIARPMPITRLPVSCRFNRNLANGPGRWAVSASTLRSRKGSRRLGRSSEMASPTCATRRTGNHGMPAMLPDAPARLRAVSHPGVPTFDGQAIRDAVPMADLLDAVEAAFRDVAAGRDRSPVRTRLEMDDGDLLLMPGLRAGGRGAAVKLVTVVPSNADRGMPTVQAVVVWFDATTGEPLAILDGTAVTAMR